MAIMPTLILAIALLLLLAGCGGRLREPPSSDRQPRAAPAQPRAAAPRQNAAPPCDPRAGDPDRGRVGLGLMAADCQDGKGRNGVYVTRLVPIAGASSPAQKAGIKVGDRLVRLDACEVGSTHDLGRQLRSAPPGWVARVVLGRGDREVEVFVATVDLPSKVEPPAAPQLSTGGCSALGRPAAR